MTYSYEFTKKAKKDLDGIYSYLAIELTNRKAIEIFDNELQNSLEQICEFPEMCPLVVNNYLPHIEIRKKFIKNYILYYVVDDMRKTNTILRIIYARRDLSNVAIWVKNKE